MVARHFLDRLEDDENGTPLSWPREEDENDVQPLPWTSETLVGDSVPLPEVGVLPLS